MAQEIDSRSAPSDCRSGGHVAVSQVLIVDNDPAFVRMIEVALAKRNFETLAAYDGLEALEIARERRPDCIVVDLILPKGGGDRATG